MFLRFFFNHVEINNNSKQEKTEFFLIQSLLEQRRQPNMICIWQRFKGEQRIQGALGSKKKDFRDVLNRGCWWGNWR